MLFKSSALRFALVASSGEMGRIPKSICRLATLCSIACFRQSLPLLFPRRPLGRSLSKNTRQIVTVSNTAAGNVGIDSYKTDTQAFSILELRQSPALMAHKNLDRKTLRCARNYYGEVRGPGLEAARASDPRWLAWDEFAKEKVVLLDAYRPPRCPTAQGGSWCRST